MKTGIYKASDTTVQGTRPPKSCSFLDLPSNSYIVCDVVRSLVSYFAPCVLQHIFQFLFKPDQYS